MGSSGYLRLLRVTSELNNSAVEAEETDVLDGPTTALICCRTAIMACFSLRAKADEQVLLR